MAQPNLIENELMSHKITFYFFTNVILSLVKSAYVNFNSLLTVRIKYLQRRIQQPL